MALDLSDTLVVRISATALFDLTESDSVFRDKYSDDPETAVAEYRAYIPSGKVPYHSDSPLNESAKKPEI